MSQIPRPDIDLASWLRKFAAIEPLFRSPDVIASVAALVVERMAHERIVYGELRFCPMTLGQHRGIPAGEVIDAVVRGVREACARHRIVVPLVVIGSRHMGPDIVAEMAREAATADPLVRAFDFAGGEDAYPHSAFVEAASVCAEASLPVLVHAGETGRPASVEEAIATLSPKRIGHGIAAASSPELMKTLAALGIPLEICISSNVYTSAVSSLDVHPLPVLARGGVSVSINTDDPALFHTNMNQEWRLATTLCGWNAGDAMRRQLQALDDGVAPEVDKGSVREMLHEYWQAV